MKEIEENKKKEKELQQKKVQNNNLALWTTGTIAGWHSSGCVYALLAGTHHSCCHIQGRYQEESPLIPS